MARCPAHDDTQPSLSITEGRDGRVLLHCFAECPTEKIVSAIGLTMRDLFLASPGLTLAAYAEAKKLPQDFLRNVGVREIRYQGRPAVSIPYLDETGREIAVRIRIALDGPDRFRWKKGSKLHLYGRWRLGKAREVGHVALVEGESDSQTGWYLDLPVLGLPGAGTWKEEWASCLEGIEIVYVPIEPDAGGKAVLKWLAASSIREKVRLVQLRDAKDVSALYLSNPDTFLIRWQAAIANAQPWTDFAAAQATARKQELWAQCESLAQDPRILDRFVDSLRAHGVVGETKVVKLIYLSVTSRFLKRVISCVIKGASSGGKSFVVEAVLKYFPADAYYVLSAMSEHALIYWDEPLSHRIFVLYEAAGLKGDFVNYIVRSLLSEGCVRYLTVEKTEQGLRPRLIEREGPTGLLMTTTAVRIHHETETRVLSLPITDTPEQTKAILREIARRGKSPAVDLTPWHALQGWLATANHRVSIPYAETLADMIPPVSIVLRRAFNTVLALIEVHAIIHQAQRWVDAEGCIVGTLQDYAAIYELVQDLIAEGIEMSVPERVRETVYAVNELYERDDNNERDKGVAIGAVARKLNLDRITAWRRVREAVDRGHLRNLELREGRPYRLAPGDPLPKNVKLLPSPDAEELVVAYLSALEARYEALLQAKRGGP